jgi:hypothetical protein
VGAAKDDGVNERVLGKKLLEGILDEVIGTRLIELIVFYERHPHGTRLTYNSGTRMEFLYLKGV